MSFLGSQRTSRTTLVLPLYGTARADVVLESGDAPAPGPASLVIGGLTLAGTILWSDVDGPNLPHAVWQQGAGWDTPLSARSYASFRTDGTAGPGVRLATVLRDLATDAGESFATDPRVAFGYTTVGLSYTRLGSTDTAPQTGRMALEALRVAGYVGPMWVDASGLTHFGDRPSGASVGRADVMRRNAAVGLRVFGLDDPSGFLPGTTLEGVTTRRLVVRERGSAIVAEAWG